MDNLQAMGWSEYWDWVNDAQLILDAREKANRQQ
jgi:hypothetical protein